MNILHPPRIDSLGKQSIRIVEHGGSTWNTTAYPFESVLSIKQRVALHHKKRDWLPQYLFLAEKTEAGWRSLEFEWPFSATLEDPTSRKGEVDKRLMEGDVRLAVYPTVKSGITLEHLYLKTPEIHVWNLAAVSADLEITDAVFGGYIQLYFPGLQVPEEVTFALRDKALTEDEKHTLDVIQTYRELYDRRLERLDSFLAKLPAEGPSLSHELRTFRYVLPRKSLPDGLDILYYEMTPSVHMPLIAYYPPQQRNAPILKIATGPSGIPLITDSKLLKLLLADQPTVEMGSVIHVKLPIPRTPIGTAWTLRILEDGSAELIIGAPRKDTPLTAAMMQEAIKMLPGFLEKTLWSMDDLKDGVLADLSAHFEYRLVDLVRKPTVAELRNRMDPFLPLFLEEPLLKGDSAAISMRWKAVSNFRKNTDPYMNYITTLYTKLGYESTAQLAPEFFVKALGDEFGMAPPEAAEYVKKWLAQSMEFVSTEGDKAVPVNSYGALVSLYNNSHPKYTFHLAGVDSEMDMRRILSLLQVFVSFSSKELNPTTDAEPEPEEPANLVQAEEVPEVAPVVEDWQMDMMNFGEFGEVPDAVEEVQEQNPDPELTEEQIAQVKAIQKDVRFPTEISDTEQPLPEISNEYYLEQLKRHDMALFGYEKKDRKDVELYSRVCQNNANKQPNVMSPESYARIRALYKDKDGKDTIHWVEAPMSSEDTKAIQLANTSPGERKKAKYKRDEIIAYEKRALRMGFPLDRDTTILQLPDKSKQAIPLEEIEDKEMISLIEEQKKKPLWIVTRAGTAMNKPNYYLCSEFWCLRDDLPLVAEEFYGTKMRSGANKPAETCPFCKGKLIEKKTAIKAGQTVLQRGPYVKGGKVAKYSGFFKDIIHPDKYPNVCCFSEPNKISPPSELDPEGREMVKPVPPPIVDLLPEAQKQQMAAIEEPKGEEEEADAAEPVKSKLLEVFEQRKMKMEFIEDRFKFLTSDPKRKALYKMVDKKIEIKARKILSTYIKAPGYFPLEIGRVGSVPQEVDEFLGQKQADYIETFRYGQIYTHPKVSARAFFRLGLGNTLSNSTRFLNFISYVKYTVGQIVPPLEKKVYAPEDILSMMFGEKEILMFHAFQQANYGSLIHEFSLNPREVADGEFKEWCKRMGLPLPEQRVYALHAYKAWLNFKDYMADESIPKELRLWEGLLAAPGLFTPHGVVLARITKTADGSIVLKCPTHGVSFRARHDQVPIVFLYEDEKSQVFEPLVFFHGPDVLIGAMETGSAVFGSLDSSVRTPLAAFYKEYMGAEGCAREQIPAHPWLPERDAGGVPRLGDLLTRMDVKSLLRDRSHRLVGVLGKTSSNGAMLYIPAIDDGSVAVQVPSVYDVEMLVYPPLDDLLEGLELLKQFKGLKPKQLRVSQLSMDEEEPETALVALELMSGALIPILPLKLPVKAKAVKHASFSALMETGFLMLDELPWEMDLHAVKSVDKPALEVLDNNPEAALSEAYQHLRLTVSEWMATTRPGRNVKKQIEQLRKAAHGRLPLFELRKRMDLLLIPFVQEWIHVGPMKSESSLLRRNCLQLKKADCAGACSWSDGRCLIHAAKTPRFMDPVFVLTARLVDELLRTHGEARQVLDRHVPRLRPPKGIVQGDQHLIVATDGDTSKLFQTLGLQGRIPSKYTRGLVYPEELGQEDIGYEPTQKGIPLTWKGIQTATWHADVSRDPYLQTVVFWASVLDTPWDEIKHLVEPEPQWNVLAEQAGVIFSFVNKPPLDSLWTNGLLPL
jgi:hypothetical protein